MNLHLIAESIVASLELDYSKSGGPGGQNVNKLNTKVTARIALDAILGLSEAERAQVARRLANRITVDGYLVIQSSEERTQGANRELAVERLIALVSAAARRDPPRIPTKPGRAARERRLAGKKARGETKAGRRGPAPDSRD